MGPLDCESDELSFAVLEHVRHAIGEEANAQRTACKYGFDNPL